jgi:hypothetical protein
MIFLLLLFLSFLLLLLSLLLSFVLVLLSSSSHLPRHAKLLRKVAFRSRWGRAVPRWPVRL